MLHFFFSSELNSNLILLVFQLRTAEEVRLHSRAFKLQITELLVEITLLYLNFKPQPPIQNESAIRQTKFKRTNKSDFDQPQTFSSDWTIDRFLIIKVIKKLFCLIKEFQDSLTYKKVLHRNETKSFTKDTSIGHKNAHQNDSRVNNLSANLNILNKQSKNISRFNNTSRPNLKTSETDINLSLSSVSETLANPTQAIISRDISSSKEFEPFNNSKELRRYFFREKSSSYQTSKILKSIEENLVIEFAEFSYVSITSSILVRLSETFSKKSRKRITWKEETNLIESKFAQNLDSARSSDSGQNLDSAQSPDLTENRGLIVLSTIDIGQEPLLSTPTPSTTEPPSNHARDQTYVRFATLLTNILKFSKFNSSHFYSFFSSEFSPQSISFDRLLWFRFPHYQQRTYSSVYSSRLIVASLPQPPWQGRRVEELRNSKSQNSQPEASNQKKTASKNKRIFEISISEIKIAQSSSPSGLNMDRSTIVESQDRSKKKRSDLSKKDIKDLAMIMFDMFIEIVTHKASITAESDFTLKNYFRATDVDFFDSKLDEFYDVKNVI